METSCVDQVEGRETHLRTFPFRGEEQGEYWFRIFCIARIQNTRAAYNKPILKVRVEVGPQYPNSVPPTPGFPAPVVAPPGLPPAPVPPKPRKVEIEEIREENRELRRKLRTFSKRLSQLEGEGR